MAPKGPEGRHRPCIVVSSCLFAAVVCCVLVFCSCPVFSKPVPIWAVFTQENSDLPSNRVWALAGGADGALWVGTEGGLARLDKEGRWQSYSKASTQGGLPADRVQALAGGADGALWVGTYLGGLGNFSRPLGRSLRIVEVIGGNRDNCLLYTSDAADE